jgi:hypothetical protein
MITPRDRLLDLVSRLRQRAWSAIDVGWPELQWPGTLPGKRIAGDQKYLMWCMENLRLICDLVEGSASGALTQSELCDLLYLSMTTAEFTGSRARMSLSQRNYYATERARAAGRSSAAKAARAPRPWQEHAKKLALELRAQYPKLSQEKLATAIRKHWRMPGVQPQEHRTIRDYISRLEKSGSLPRRA